MGRITSLFSRKVAGQVGPPDVAHELLRLVGLDAAGEPDPSLMIRDDDYYRLFEEAAAVDADPTTLPLRVGASMRADDYGPFGFAWKSAPTLRGSFARAERYALVLTSVSFYSVEECFGGAYMHLHRQGDRRLGMRLSNEATLASILAISREVASEPFHPEAVFLKHRAPRDAAGHEAHFGCPVHFGSDRDALRVSTRALDAPNRVGDASIAGFFDTLLDAEVGSLDDTIPLERRVLDRVATSLSGGVPTLSDVARELGMSGRTLQRRLGAEETSFQTLVDEARRRLALRLLQDPDAATLSEATYMTGFSDQSAFTRAFKRWTGLTPGAYRDGAGPDAPSSPP
ncbi:MAG: AraC family transcriptional regulator [Gemmatimonadota bacterium]|nr:AraC family transcriptional regulator [Gemmatimonadota bacterium]